MTQQPSQNSVPRVRTFKDDVSRAKESQRIASTNPKVTQAYLQEALEDFANIKGSDAIAKESILAEKDESIFSLDETQRGTIITDQKTKGGKLRKAVSNSLSSWVTDKKKKVANITKPKQLTTGEKITPAALRVATIKKAATPAKLGATATAPLAKKIIKKNIPQLEQPAQLIKPAKRETPHWTHTVNENPSVPKPVTIEKKFKPTPGSLFVPTHTSAVQKNAPAVTGKVFKSTPISVVAKTEKKAAKITMKKTSSEATPLLTLQTPSDSVLKQAPEPSAEVASQIATKKIQLPESKKPATSTADETSMSIITTESTAPKIPVKKTLPQTQSNNLSVLASLKNIGLAAALMLVLIAAFYTGKHFTGGKSATPVFVASDSFFTEERQTHVTATETENAISNIKTIAITNSGLTRITFPDESAVLENELTGLPTQFGALDTSPFIILYFGSSDAAFGTMLNIERSLPESLKNLFNLSDSNITFTNVSYDGHDIRSGKENGLEKITYLQAGRGVIIISDRAATVSKIRAHLK